LAVNSGWQVFLSDDFSGPIDRYLTLTTQYFITFIQLAPLMFCSRTTKARECPYAILGYRQNGDKPKRRHAKTATPKRRQIAITKTATN